MFFEENIKVLRTNVLNREIFCYFLIIFFFLLFGCQTKNEKKDTVYSPYEQFIKDYDISDVTKDIDKKKDSLGELVLSLPNSLETRNLISEFGSRSRNNKRYGDRLLDYSIKSHDTSGIAKGYLLKGYYYNNSLIYDSAYACYYQAENMFLQTRDSLNISQSLLLKAVILNKNGLYYEAEKEILGSILYNTSETYLRRKYQQDLTVGDVFSGLEFHDDALYFYNRALDVINGEEILKEMYSGMLTLHKVYVLSKIAVIYHKKGNYDKAEEILVNTISKYIDLSNTDSERYYGYLAIDLANVRMKKNIFIGVKSLIDQAISIGEKNKNRTIIHNAQVALAEYYYLTQKPDLAILLLNKVISESQAFSDFVTELNALELLVTYSNKDSPKYFTEYLEKSKMQKGESSVIRNNFVRIKSETDALLQQNKELGSKNKKLIVLGICVIFILINILLFYLYRIKLRKLRIEKMFHRDTEQYYNSIINIQNHLTLIKEKERKIMAKELNDGAYNKLFATRFYLTFLEVEKVLEEKTTLANEIVEVEQYIRKMSHVMFNENTKEAKDFEQLLHDLVSVQMGQLGIDFDFQIDENLDLERLSHRSKINIYRSIQEVLLNVTLHSQASKCTMNIQPNSLSAFEISISDDGVGFDVRKIKKGSGLINIKERIEIIHGKFFMFSKRGEGTRVVFNLPY